MSILSAPHFHNEAAAIARLEGIVWPNGPYCPRCGGFDRITDVKGGRMGLRRCGPCKREFTVTVGTIFERSHVKLHIWFQAAHLMASSKKGISAHQLHRTLQVTYKTAWFMEHRLREAMRDGNFTVMGGEGKTVEIDETYVGGKEANKHKGKRNKKNIGGMGKEPVFSLVERGGKVRADSDDCGRLIRLNAAKRSDRRRAPFPMKATRLHYRHDDLGQGLVAASRLVR